MWYIYVLVHPVTRDFLYVGKSKNPCRRLEDHWKERFREQSKKASVLRSLPIRPDILIIESGRGWKAWGVAESRWISILTYLGEPLTNGTSGGAGYKLLPTKHNVGWKHTNEAREKMREKKLGRVLSRRVRDKISESLQGNSNRSKFKAVLAAKRVKPMSFHA